MKLISSYCCTIFIIIIIIGLSLIFTSIDASRIRVRQGRRQWCRGSRRLEHLRGRCIPHYECVQNRGISIGHCFTNLVVASCCMLPDPQDDILNFHRQTFFHFKINSDHPNNNEIQSKHISAVDSGDAQGNHHSKTIPTDDLLTSTTTITTEQIIMIKNQTAITNNMTTKNFADCMDNDKDNGNENVQNPINSNKTATTTTIPLDLNSTFNSITNNKNNNWSSSLPTTRSMEESIITATKMNAYSTPRPIEINQNEFYEIILNRSATTMTKGTITNNNHSSNSNQNLFIQDIPIHFPIISPTPTASITTTTTTTTRSFSSPKLCGVRPLRPTGRVVGGRNAQFGEWPWQVLIKEKSWLGFFTKSKCGGVLIDYKWILTAAHCQPGMMGSLIVMLGQHELHGTSRQLRPVVKTVRRMIVHRDFDPDTFDNDIALLELDTPFEMQPHIVPICMPNKDEDYVGQLAYVAGWGKLSYGGTIPSVLQTVRLPIIDNNLCQTMFADAGHYKYIRNSFLCAGYTQGGRDTCEGDSGGPLMMKRDDVWTLIGTVSHGIKCAEPNLPGVYMKTWSYLPWIRGIIERTL
ncbi:uncharacterized protein LOC124495712 isoform X2 [Dermatophagoides farinae]|uniref:Group 3 mite allergen-like protein n=1 Tax=Dermatophagoides farinae TaxID=6954 RepID=A0A922I9I3_DERFA|nr:group 3 mite allergen-like protein [Dermatophagoides farinae]KAH9526101.1 Transmembrane protease serine 11D [Dermatophagoides farinae]